MKTKHTPGPWKIQTIEEFVHTNDDYKKIIGGDGCYNNRTGFDLTGYMGDANAKLIAAAPELLEALKMFVDAWHLEGLEKIGAYNLALGYANAAITKATE